MSIPPTVVPKRTRRKSYSDPPDNLGPYAPQPPTAYTPKTPPKVAKEIPAPVIFTPTRPNLAQQQDTPQVPGGFSEIPRRMATETIIMEEIKQEEEQLSEEIKEQRRRETELRRQQHRRDQPHASSSREQPLDTSTPAAHDESDYEERPRRKGKRREEVHDTLVSDSESSSSMGSIDTDTMKNKNRHEQTETIARAGRKITGMMIQEVANRQSEVPADVVREGFVHGARQTIDRYGQGPHVPSIYGRRTTEPPDPYAWRPYQYPTGPPQGGGGPPGPGGGGGPPQGGPPGPGGGPPGGQPPIGPANLGPPAYFQRGAWSTGRQEFRRSFHPGTAPGGMDLKLAKPPLFDGAGSPEEAEIWIQQVERHFILQPHLYGTDQRAIAWATSYLGGTAAMWYQPYWSTVGRTNHAVTQRWAMFVHAFLEHFGDPDAETKAETRIRNLKQHTSVRKYVDEFNTLQTKLQWEELALISQFKEGLKAGVIRFGGTFGWPRSLEGVKQTALQLTTA